MSHFTVLVIGENPEEQLEPFDENLETPEYCKGEISEESKSNMVDYYTRNGQNPDGLGFDELYAIKGKDWDGGSLRKNPITGVWEEFSTYNPNSKWDWFQLGGRWSGLLKLKPKKLLPFHLEGFTPAEVNNFVELCKENPTKFIEVTSKYNGKTESIRKAIADIINSMENPQYPEHGMGEKSWANASEEDSPGYADQAYKRDIDFEGMRNEAEATCREEYDKILAIFGGTIPTIEHKWETIIDGQNPFFSPMTIDEKREFYHAQAGCKEVTKHKEELGWSFDLDKYQKPIDQLVKEARESAGQTFAILKDGVWYEKGKMGWWACVSDEKKNWSEEFAKLLDEIPDDTLLSVYDCHI
jgi:hypothetical protein